MTFNEYLQEGSYGEIGKDLFAINIKTPDGKQHYVSANNADEFMKKLKSKFKLKPNAEMSILAKIKNIEQNVQSISL